MKNKTFHNFKIVLQDTLLCKQSQNYIKQFLSHLIYESLFVKLENY